MAGQRTFTLIPQHPGRHDPPPDEPARPMTSKQVKKAYKDANRGPKLSRAERIKQERAEQERIRKEFEKEKAAAKAKVAREKKKEKEHAEREVKRKKGLPLVSVRPSQETISWFVRGNGTAKKRDAQGKQVEAKKSPGPESPRSPTPEPRLDKISEEEEEEQEQDQMETRQEEELKKKVDETMDETIDESTEEKREENVAESGEQTTPEPEEEKMEEPEQDKREEGEKIDMGLDDLDDSFEEDIALELLEHVEASARQVSIQKTNQIEQQPIVQPPTTDTTMQRESKPTSKHEREVRFEKPAQPKPSPPRPCPILQVRSSPSPSPSPPRQAPPLSTQAILFNFDDFFPSPSQQARELEEGLDDEDFDFSIEPRREPEKPEPPEPSLPEPACDSPSPPPRRFFTSSGSHELMSIALQRSRRTAALEQMQRRDRARREAAEAEAEVQARMRRDEARAKAAAAAAAQPQAKLVAKPNGLDRSTSKTHAVMQRKPENAKLNRQIITPGKPVPKPRPPPPQQQQQEASKPWTPRPNLTETRSNNATPRAHAKTNITTTRASTTTRPDPPPKVPVRSSPRRSTMQGHGNNNKENKVPHTPAAPPCEAQAPSASQETDYGGGEWLDDIASELMI